MLSDQLRDAKDEFIKSVDYLCRAMNDIPVPLDRDSMVVILDRMTTEFMFGHSDLYDGTAGITYDTVINEAVALMDKYPHIKANYTHHQQETRCVSCIYINQ